MEYMTPEKCNLCGSDKYVLVYKAYSGDVTLQVNTYRITDHSKILPLRLVKCQKCSLIYASPKPPHKDIVYGYTNMVDDAYLKEEKGHRLSARSILKTFERYRKRGRLLDIGCATGFLLDEARKKGWQVYGVELSKWAVDFSRNHLGIGTILQCSFEDAGYPDNFFDVIVMKDIIEHLEDPRKTLIGIRKKLKVNGILCVNTPNVDSLISKILKAKWWGIKHSHLYYFTRNTLYKMLDKSGLIPLKSKSHVRIFTLDYLISQSEGYSKTLCNLLKFLAKHKIIRSKLLRINLGDQIEVYAKKARKLQFLNELEKVPYMPLKKKMKKIVVLPAYNASMTLKKTVDDIPKGSVDEIICVDDASRDNTSDIAKELGLRILVHKKNKGYGANQKTCYKEALKRGADVIVMVHPDYQYDPSTLPKLIAPIELGKADAVFGSRMMKGGALEGGMPLWKHNA
ncbi:MAG: methyltransferase domain-containing protein, partial [Candidatus Omnitrophota bacterium]